MVLTITCLCHLESFVIRRYPCACVCFSDGGAQLFPASDAQLPLNFCSWSASACRCDQTGHTPGARVAAQACKCSGSRRCEYANCSPTAVRLLLGLARAGVSIPATPRRERPPRRASAAAANAVFAQAAAPEPDPEDPPDPVAEAAAAALQPKRKRGRPRKVEASPVAPTGEVAAPPLDASPPAKRKRGRPPKVREAPAEAAGVSSGGEAAAAAAAAGVAAAAEAAAAAGLSGPGGSLPVGSMPSLGLPNFSLTSPQSGSLDLFAPWSRCAPVLGA